MSDDTKTDAPAPTATATAQPAQEEQLEWQPSSSKIVRLYSHPWSQIILISMICFCLPGVGLFL